MSKFAQLQQNIVDLLKNDSTLADLEILHHERKDLVNKINQLMLKLGLCAIVQNFEMTVSKPNLPGPVFDQLKLSVLVVENALINRAKSDRTALSVAEEIAKALHHKTLEGSTLCCLGIFAQDHPRDIIWAVDFTL